MPNPWQRRDRGRLHAAAARPAPDLPDVEFTLVPEGRNSPGHCLKCGRAEPFAATIASRLNADMVSPGTWRTAARPAPDLPHVEFTLVPEGTNSPGACLKCGRAEPFAATIASRLTADMVSPWDVAHSGTARA